MEQHRRTADELLRDVRELEGLVLVVRILRHTDGVPNELFDILLFAKEIDELVVSLNTANTNLEVLKIKQLSQLLGVIYLAIENDLVASLDDVASTPIQGVLLIKHELSSLHFVSSITRTKFNLINKI